MIVSGIYRKRTAQMNLLTLQEIQTRQSKGYEARHYRTAIFTG